MLRRREAERCRRSRWRWSLAGGVVCLLLLNAMEERQTNVRIAGMLQGRSPIVVATRAAGPRPAVARPRHSASRPVAEPQLALTPGGCDEQTGNVPTFYAVGYLLRWLWRAIRPLLAVAALSMLAGYVYLNVSSGRALESELARIQSKGEPLSLREAAPPAVPEGQTQRRCTKRRSGICPGSCRGPEAISRSSPRRTNASCGSSSYSNDPRHRPERVQCSRSARCLPAPMRRWRSIAAQRQCRAAASRSIGRLALGRLPALPQAGRLDPADGRSRDVGGLGRGHADQAMSDLSSIVGMTEHIAREPVMIGLLVQYSCLTIAEYSLQRVLETSSPTVEACRRLDQQLADLDLDGPLERAVEMERCFGLWCFNLVSGSDPAKLPGFARRR